MILYGQRQDEIVTLRLDPKDWEGFWSCHKGFIAKILKRELAIGEKFAYEVPLEQGREVNVEGWNA